MWVPAREVWPALCMVARGPVYDDEPTDDAAELEEPVDDESVMVRVDELRR